MCIDQSLITFIYGGSNPFSPYPNENSWLSLFASKHSFVVCSCSEIMPHFRFKATVVPSMILTFGAELNVINRRTDGH